jgi:hypothetical protein
MDAIAENAVAFAQNQALWREVNERMKDLNEAFDHSARFSEFLCECANRNCVEHVFMTVEEYERVRLVPTHFLVLPGERHVFPGVERVVEEHDGYVVVEKFGDAGRMATKLDPRSRHRIG